jgi:hypothetical protein
MKSKLVMKWAVLLLFAGGVAHAQGNGAGNGHGGGNAALASDNEIRKEILVIWQKLDGNEDSIYEGFVHLGEQLSDIKDETLKRVFAKMYDKSKNPDGSGNTYPVMKALEMTELTIQENAPCIDPQDPKHPKMAAVTRNEITDDLLGLPLSSVLDNRNRAEVCFSIPMLRGLSRAGMYDTLFGLSAHETTHLLGFGEQEAKRVEIFFGKDGRLLVHEAPSTLKKAREIYSGFAYGLEALGNLDWAVASDPEVCQEIGRVIVRASDLYQEVTWLPDGSDGVPVEAGNLAMSIERILEEKVQTFCGQMLERPYFNAPDALLASVAPVKPGDRRALKAALETINSQTPKLARWLGWTRPSWWPAR